MRISRNLAVTAVALGLSCCTSDTPVKVGPPVSYQRTAPVRNPGSFRKGDSPETVQAVMGGPDLRREVSGMLIWDYKFSTVTFSRGRVSSWNNTSRNLRVQGAGEESETVIAENGSTGPQTSLPVPDGIAGRLSQSGGYTGQPTNPSIVEVSSYRKADGTMVTGHYRTNGDTRTGNNFSYRGNLNPYTGKKGSR